MDGIKNFFSIIWLPLFALTALASFYVVWKLFDLPPQDEVIRLAEVYFDRYGLITVFICAILEAVLFLGWYFPGSLVIVLAVVFAGNDPVQVVGVFSATTLGFFVAYPFNYFVGKYGWYRLLMSLGLGEPLRKAQRQLTTYGPRAIFFTYWHPNLAGLTSTAAGILLIPFRTFFVYTVIATVLWDAAWTVLGFSLGRAAITAIGPKFVIAFIAIWITLSLWYAYKKKADASDTSGTAVPNDNPPTPPTEPAPL